MTDIRILEVAGVTKVLVDGRLDTFGVNAVENKFQASVIPAGSPAIVDLSNVSFVASLGIRMLLSAARALRNRGKKLAVFGATPLVAEIFTSAALEDLLPLHRSEAEALAEVTA